MQSRWAFLVAASLLNALLITGVFIALYPRGFTITDLSYPGSPVKIYTINAGLFSVGTLVLSFFILMTILGIAQLVSGIITKLKIFNESLSGAQSSQLTG